MVSKYWQVARVAGKVPNLKKSQAEASRDSAMRGAPLHVYYIQFGQYPHPIVSSRPPWAAGEYEISRSTAVQYYLHKPPDFRHTDKYLRLTGMVMYFRPSGHTHYILRLTIPPMS